MIGEFVSIDDCDQGEPVPCPSSNDVFVFLNDPNIDGVTAAQEVTRENNAGEFSLSLPPGSYFVCRLLGDAAFDCTTELVIDDETPILQLVYTFDGADSAWTVEDC